VKEINACSIQSHNSTWSHINSQQCCVATFWTSRCNTDRPEALGLCDSAVFCIQINVIIILRSLWEDHPNVTLPLYQHTRTPWSSSIEEQPLIILCIRHSLAGINSDKTIPLIMMRAILLWAQPVVGLTAYYRACARYYVSSLILLAVFIKLVGLLSPVSKGNMFDVDSIVKSYSIHGTPTFVVPSVHA